MSKRPPYLEIAVTLAILAFLGLVIVGSFDQHASTEHVTMQTD
jgi:TRAP-type C4-dicarboxylate transport system permease small subunit